MIEPVISSLAGACLSPFVTFRSAKRPNIRITTTPMPSRVRRIGVSQAPQRDVAFLSTQAREGVAFRPRGQRERVFYNATA